MRRLNLIVSIFVSLLLSIAAAGRLRAQQGARHRVAVLGFSDSAGSGASQAVFGAPVDIGKGISQMLIARLAGDGAYQVTAPAKVEEILKAQGLSGTAAADPAAAAKIGYTLGVDVVVVGAVTQFGWDSQAGMPREASAESTGKKNLQPQPTHRAAVAITAELIDTNNGQVLVTANSKGVSRRSGTKLLDTGAKDGSGPSPTMASSNFTHSMMGEAATAAIDELAKELDGESANLPRWTPPPPRGQITQASTANIVIDVGSAAGLKVGDKMLVTRVVHVERDRVTESAVGAVEDEVGVLTIVSVKPDSAVGRFSGPKAAKVGDRVRPLQ